MQTHIQNKLNILRWLKSRDCLAVLQVTIINPSTCKLLVCAIINKVSSENECLCIVSVVNFEDLKSIKNCEHVESLWQETLLLWHSRLLYPTYLLELILFSWRIFPYDIENDVLEKLDYYLASHIYQNNSFHQNLHLSTSIF